MAENIITVNTKTLGGIQLHTKEKYCDYDINVDTQTAEASIFDGSLSSYSNDKIITLRPNAFRGQDKLKSINLPACTKIGASAFYDCPMGVLGSTIIFPEVQKLTGTYNFYCSGSTSTTTGDTIAELILPKLTTIETFSSNFENRRNLRKLILPNLEPKSITQSIESRAFRDCVWLEALVLGGEKFFPLGSTDAFANTGVNNKYHNKKFTLYVREYDLDGNVLPSQYENATTWNAVKGLGEVKTIKQFFEDYDPEYSIYWEYLKDCIPFSEWPESKLYDQE